MLWKRPFSLSLALLVLLAPLCARGTIVINEFMAANKSTLLDEDGVSSDWLELYNAGTTNVSLDGWYLTDDAGDLVQWKIPAVSLSPHEYLVIFASGENRRVATNELHTNFGLKKDGEYLALVATNGIDVIHEFSPLYPPQVTDMSYGLGPLDDLRFFADATPGSANTVGAEEFVGDTKYSPDRGIYTNPVTVTISCSTPGATIYVTTDFTYPTTNSTVYTGPITISSSTCLRALAASPGLYPSDADTHTYIFLNDVITQSAAPGGFPESWSDTTADYAMDPLIVTNVLYSARMQDALTSIPSISIVTEMENLFDGTTGIYSHPLEDGVEWERPTSFEWIKPDGQKGFQVNAGLRIYGGSFRRLDRTRKKSFRVLFKSEYGPSKLKQDLFDSDSATDSFNTLILRAGANDSWWDTFATPAKIEEWDTFVNENTQFVVDEFMRRTHLAMGQPAGHGTFAHVYLNGLYWGMYNLVERPDTAFSSTYFGGDDEDWDGLNAGNPTGDSNTETWNQMKAQANGGLSDNTAYQKIQGLNLDGTVNTNYTDLLDVDNYITYMLANFWGGTYDWPAKNYYVGCRRPPDSTGFKSYIWDAEQALSSVTIDNTR